MEQVSRLITVGALASFFVAAAEGQQIAEIIDSSGDGAGNPLVTCAGIALDEAGNVYVAGWDSNNVFRIDSGGTKTEILDDTGDGAGNVMLQADRLTAGLLTYA